MKKLFLILLCTVLTLSASSHPWKPKHYVIIDSDGGTDDMKAISLLLASPDVRVLAIIASPGALSADLAYVKIRSFLDRCWHEGIPVAINRDCLFRSPEFGAATEYKWGEESGIDPSSAPDYLETISDIVKSERSGISFISLGGLSSVAAAERKIAGLSLSVSEIIWSCDGLSDKKGFNFKIDPSSVSSVLSGKIPVRAIERHEQKDFYDTPMCTRLDSVNTLYAETIRKFQNSPSGKTHQFSLSLTDELVPVYLHAPDAFTTVPSGTNSDSYPSDWNAVRNIFIKILRGETVMKNQTMLSLPSDPSFYFPDIQPYVTEIINKYGENEWTSAVLANELHRHLGVMAVIGVKMGIRAREYFNTGVDEFKTLSYAGSEPPLSCMNDGLQVSTGSTPGHGLLTVINDSTGSPVAEFTYMNRRIRLTLKPEFAAKIRGELKEINFVYGLDSNIYWELVRKNTIRYWKDLDRHYIFTIEKL